MDNGIGIDAQSLPKIFEEFEQGERRKMGGLGLGLAITKALVERHGGKITAESWARKGGNIYRLFSVGRASKFSSYESVALPGGRAKIDADLARRRSRRHKPLADQSTPAAWLSGAVGNQRKLRAAMRSR